MAECVYVHSTATTLARRLREPQPRRGSAVKDVKDVKDVKA